MDTQSASDPQATPESRQHQEAPIKCLGITGAGGFVGSHLLSLAQEKGIPCVGFSRDPQKQIAGCREVREIDPSPQGALPDLSGCDVVVNLAGESILGLWSSRKKDRMLHSRAHVTQKVVAAMKAQPRDQRPKALVNASGIHYYGDRGEAIVTEREPRDARGGFLVEMTETWEGDAQAAEALGVRVALLRISMVLGRESGAFPLMKKVFNLGMGGNLGSGMQWTPWIHVRDLARLILFSAARDDIAGVINATSPAPVRNEDFTETLANVLDRPAFLHTPRPMLKLALGEMSSIALYSVRAIPQKAMAAGFSFEFPDLEPAFQDLARQDG
jgi:hypothetical protein